MFEEMSLGELRKLLTDRVGIILKATREDLDFSQEKLASILGARPSNGLGTLAAGVSGIKQHGEDLS